MRYSFGFVGVGNMGGALAIAATHCVSAERIVLSDRNAEKAEQLAAQLSCHSSNLDSLLHESEYVFLGLKPQVLPQFLREIAPQFAQMDQPPVLISMAAGLTISQLESYLAAPCPIIRIMPNTPVAEGAGVILYSHNSLVGNSTLASFLTAMSAAGQLYPLDENLMDAGSAVSGCGPAFAYLFIDALADGGVACGLSRADAINFAAQTVLGAAQMVLATDKHPEQLKNEVCSPGGSTIQGVRKLEQHGLRSACMEAVIAAFDKTCELGK